MRNPTKLYRMPVTVLILGAAGFALRQGLYILATDQRNLLLRGHPLEYLLWALMLCGTLLIVAALWRQRDNSGPGEQSFAPSLPAALGCFCFAAGIGVTMLSGHSGSSAHAMFAGQTVTPYVLSFVWQALGWLSVPLMIWAGVRRLQGKAPDFLCHVLVCAFLLMHVLNQYQRWCSNPQLLDYVFALTAVLSLAFFHYHTAAFAIGRGNRRMYLGSGLLTVLFGLTGLSGEEFPFLYLGGAVFAVTNLCFLLPRPKDEEAAHDPS